MGASVQPLPSGDQIMANVNAMKAQGATDNDIEAYLRQSGLTPDQDTSLSMRNLGRSFVQGGTFGFGDELGLTDRSKANAFKAEHPIADFLAKVAGGSIAPIAATMAAPELFAGAGGAALLGGASGALSGAGEADGSAMDRLKGAGIGGVTGALGGVAGYGTAKAVGGIGSKVADRINPERAVLRNAAGLLTPEVRANMATADKIAPGGASVLTTGVPEETAGKPVSRFMRMIMGVGKSPEAGTTAEGYVTQQRAALEGARKAIGAKMDELQGDVPITPELRGALNKVRSVLGAKTPNVPDAELADLNPLGLEKSEPFAFDPAKETMTVGELRDALSRLRFLSRGAVKKGLEANGIDTRNIGQARSALQSYLYDQRPEFAALDRQYATAANQQRQADLALKAVQRSRANHAASDAYGASAGSVGGSLPQGYQSFLHTIVDKILTDQAGAADAVAKYIVKPGGPEMVDQILARAPKDKAAKAAAKYAPAATAALIPGMRGLLFPAQQP